MQTIVQTPTPNLDSSLAFYQNLGFSLIKDNISKWVTDGSVVIEINPDRYARAGVKLYQEDWSSVANDLGAQIPILATPNGYQLHDPCGVMIYLEQGVSPISNEHAAQPPSSLGNFAGLSLETLSFEKAVNIWKMVGFEGEFKDDNPGWVALMHPSGLGVCFMKPNTCPHLFFNPSLTYFNGGKNLAVIKAIREASIPIAEEITHFNNEGIVDNVILRDPGGYGFFVFND